MNSICFKISLDAKKFFPCRSYYYHRTRKPTLYTILSPLGDPFTSLSPKLDSWVASGNKVRVAELQRIIRDFRKRKRFSQALEVSEWMNETEACLFSSVEHAVHLDLIGRVRGYSSAEKYFENLREKDKNEKTFGALLNCYVRQRHKEKAASHFTRMKQLGFAGSALSYNNMMCLYTNLGEHDEVLSLLHEMKQSNVTPDNASYRICICSYGVRSDTKGLANILEEMEKLPGIVMDWNTYTVVANFYAKAGQHEKAKTYLREAEDRLDAKDDVGYNHLMTLYAAMGDKHELMRIWDLQKEVCGKQINRDYKTMLESLMKLGEVGEAEEVMREWRFSGNCYDARVPGVVVIGCCKLGLYEKGEEILNGLVDRRKATTPNSWATVGGGFVDRGDMEKGFGCMKMAFGICEEGRGWKPNPRVVLELINWLEEEGRFGDGRFLAVSLRNAMKEKKRFDVGVHISSNTT